MKKYDFETVSPRYGMGSGKWDEMKKLNPDTADDVIPFSVADMELQIAPEIKEGLKKFIDTTILGYAGQSDVYRASVCRWMEKRHDWKIEPEWIQETQGVVDAFFTAVKAYTKEGEGIMLMTPVYYPMYMAISNNNRVLVDNKLIRRGNTYEIDFEDFEAKAKDPNTKLLILCSPHNPTGRVWTLEELTRIGRICIDNGVLIVSDEIHFDLISPGHKHTVFASISDEFAQHSVILTAPSKTFNIAGLKTSNIIIANSKLRETFVKELKTTSGHPACNILGYEACRIAYDNGGEWLDQVIDLIDKNRKIITEFLSKEFPQIQVMDMQGTYLLWLDLGGLGIECRELERILRREAQLFFDEGYIFGKAGECFERWNLACPTKYIYDGLSRLKTTLDKYIK